MSKGVKVLLLLILLIKIVKEIFYPELYPSYRRELLFSPPAMIFNTEYQVANVRFKGASQRVKELINIAHPDFRDELTFQAKKIG